MKKQCTGTYEYSACRIIINKINTEQHSSGLYCFCLCLTGSIINLLCEEGVYGVLTLLESMLTWREWETRHGGLLGLKYLLAVRDDLRTKLLMRSYPHIYKGVNGSTFEGVGHLAD